MRANARKFVRHFKAHGFRSAMRTAAQRLVGTGPVPGGFPAPQPAASGKLDIIDFYRSFLGEPHGDAADLANVGDQTLQWVIPNFGFGSGGHLNIFRYINMLADRGFRQRLVILPPFDWPDPAAARAALEKWYFPLKAEIALGVSGFAPSDITLATGWQTAYWVAHHRATREKFYFVQDFEPWFQPVSSEYFLAENTYRLGLKGITAGDWLAKKLSQEYGMQCGAVSFGCELDHYVPQPRQEQRNFNILFYSRHVTRRRLFELGLVALAEVCEREPNVAVIFAGGDVSGFKIPFEHLNAGELTLAELPDLYSQCDLALVLSGTNLSLLPLELAACKCPVVMNDSPSTRWLLPETAAYYAPPDPEGMARTMLEAIRDEKGRLARREAAFEIAQEASWEKQADKLVSLLQDMST